MLTGTRFNLEVNPKIPQRLARLEELANNLWYSWDIMPTRALFSRLDPVLWNTVGHSPKALLKRIDQRRLTDAAEDKLFIDNYNRVLSAYDSYHGEQTRRAAAEVPLAQSELVAYFRALVVSARCFRLSRPRYFVGQSACGLHSEVNCRSMMGRAIIRMHGRSGACEFPDCRLRS